MHYKGNFLDWDLCKKTFSTTVHSNCVFLQADANKQESAALVACEACQSTDTNTPMLLCGDGHGSGCDRGFHARCLTPALAEVPEGDWHCADCDAGGREVSDSKQASSGSPKANPKPGKGVKSCPEKSRALKQGE